MLTLALLIIPPLIGLVIIIVGAVWVTDKLAYWSVGRKHQLMEEILATGDVPRLWRKKFSPKLAKLDKNPDKARQVQRRAQLSYIRELDRLIDYTATTPLVADEDTRQELLSRLHTVRSDWSNPGISRPWAEESEKGWVG